MNKFVMAIAMAALIGAAVVAGMNNKKLANERGKRDELNADHIRLHNEAEQQQQKKEAAEAEQQVASGENQQVKGDLSVAQDDLRRRNSDVERMAANMAGKEAQLEELALLKSKLQGRTVESVTAEYEGLQAQLEAKNAEEKAARDQIFAADAAVERNVQRITELENDEVQRRERVKLAGMEADVIAINRDYGFVIINAGSDLGVPTDSTLLVQRGIDRIARLKIVSVEPKVTIADIVAGTVSPGAQILVRDKVIFESLRQ